MDVFGLFSFIIISYFYFKFYFVRDLNVLFLFIDGSYNNDKTYTLFS